MKELEIIALLEELRSRATALWYSAYMARLKTYQDIPFSARNESSLVWGEAVYESRRANYAIARLKLDRAIALCEAYQLDSLYERAALAIIRLKVEDS